MNKALWLPLSGVVVAVAVNAGMDLVGQSGISFASLLPLLLIFWAIQRLPRKSVGLAIGRLRHYGLAILHPVLIIGAITLVCLVLGVVDISKTNWLSAGIDFMAALAMSIPLAILTEEGFFRGWLYGSLKRAGLSELQVMIWTGIAFALWHIPAVSMNTEDALPLAQIPVLIVNAAVIGMIWGMLRAVSGSIIVTGICHSVWNAAVYVFFGFGTTVGALGVKNTALYGPESGYLGLGLNLFLAFVIWHWWKRRKVQEV